MEAYGREHGDDEEDRVGAPQTGLCDLVLVEDEVFAEDGGTVREGIDGLTSKSHVEQGTLEPGGLGKDGDDGCASEGVSEGLVCRVGVWCNVAFGRACALDLGHEGGRSGFEARNERNKRRGKVKGEEGVEVALRGAGERLGMLDVLEALCIDALKDGGRFGFHFCCVLDSWGESVVGKGGENVVKDERIWVFLPGAAFEAKKVAKEGVAALGENTLGVVLDGFEDELAMTDTHDDAAFLGDASDHELLGERFQRGTEGVVASGGDALGDAFEAASPIVSNEAELAVFDLAGIAVVVSAHS